MRKMYQSIGAVALLGLLFVLVPAFALAQDPTVEPTEEAMEATEEAMEETMEATVEPTEEMMEATVEPTEEAVMEATEEAVMEATAEPEPELIMEGTAEPTEEAEAMPADAGGVVCDTDVIVQADDWLSKLAEKFLGDVLAYPVIADATNTKAAVDSSYATIENVDIIEIGWKLCVPATAADTTEAPAMEATEEAMDAMEPTVEPTEEMMMEGTVEATEEAMMEATVEPTEEAMDAMEPTVEPTEEAMDSMEPTAEPTEEVTQ